MQTDPLERYTILHELGRGAIGTVHAARDRATGTAVALKILDPALFTDANATLAERFLENAHSAATLRHRNIVRILDAGEAGGSAYVAMELVEGESLRTLLDAGPLPVAHAIQIFDDIASALAYAHEEGIVHRGVKPSNILVSSSRVAKIGDFGTGQIGEAALRYMSPEQVRREAVDHRSDLFSLGAVFYEMLTGRAAFAGDSAEQVRQNIRHAQPPLPSTLNPHVPAALDALVSRLLAPLPDDRFGNARVVLRDLQRLDEALGLRPAASASPPEPPPSAPPPDEPFRAQEAWIADERGPRPEPSSGSRASRLAALVLVLALLAIGLTVLLHDSPGLVERLTLATRTPEAPTPATVAPPPPLPAPSAEPPVATKVVEKPLPPEPLVEEPLVEEPPVEKPQPVADTPKPRTRAAARLVIAVLPRGEIYIDGEHRGTTPPITTLDLEPGMHRVEIRGASRKPYLTYVMLDAGDERRIRHDFAAKAVRPPR